MKTAHYAMLLGGLLPLGAAACTTIATEPRAAATATSAPAETPATASSATAQVPVDRWHAVAGSMLAALNDGDYPSFSAKWEQALLDDIGEDAFAQFRAATLADVGRFVRITGVDSAPSTSTPGVTNYFVDAEFERGERVLRLGVRDGSVWISGVELRPGRG